MGSSSICSRLPLVRLPPCHDGADEGKGCHCHVQDGYCSCDCREARAEASCRQEVHGYPDRSGHQGGEEDRQVHHSRPLHAEDQNEASDQGWQEGDLRESGDGEGEACEDGCQGLLCVSPEEEHLSLFVWCAYVDVPHK